MSLRDGLDILKMIQELKPKLRPAREAISTTALIVVVATIAALFGFDILRTTLSAAVLFVLLLIVRCFSAED